MKKLQRLCTTIIPTAALRFQSSTDMLVWTDSTEGIDYSIRSSIDNGDGTTTVTIEFLRGTAPECFYRGGLHDE